MTPKAQRLVAAAAVCAAAAWIGGIGRAQQPAAAGGEWRSYAGDLRNHHYSPLDQINAANFNALEIAWRFKTDFLGPRPEFKLEGTPLMANGTLYTTGGTRRAVVALDAATGELKWMHAEHEAARAAAAPRQLSGRRLWTFNTIPRPGEFGNDTWEKESWAVNGNVGVWNQIAADEELGLAYLPVETPSSDFYGGLRPGNNLFAESIVAIDYKTGVRRWHYQLVHHPIWNMDIAAAPILVDLTVGGRPVKAVAAMGKQAMLYLFNRVTGEPIFPIEERPVPQSDVPGEKTSPTQPFPTKPPAYHYQAVTIENLIDFTPELRTDALKIAARYKHGRSVTPPPVSRREGPIGGFRSSGGTNWPGGSFDPETHIAYVPSFTAMPVLGLLPPPNREFSDLPYVSGNALTGVRYISGPGENVGADARPAPAVRGNAPISST